MSRFVFGVDLDGVVGHFYGFMRTIAAQWWGKDPAELPADVTYGLPEWGFPTDDGGVEYKRMHRFAVTQRQLFRELAPIDGAPQGLRRLSNEGVHIRIITHRLFIEQFHQPAVAQTVEWLDHHAIPYRDLCFMSDKGAVGADVYVDDTPDNITALREAEQDVIIFTNSTNAHMESDAAHRASTWPELVDLVLARKAEAQ
jgi:5'(3')-deoxyribonucleotidase